MKTVLVTGDPWITDAEMLMVSLEHLFKVKALPDEFEVISQNFTGVEATINPVLESAGIKVTIVEELPEVIDIIVVFLDNTDQRAYDIMMNQWHSKRPVYPFHVGKKNGSTMSV